MAIKAVQLILNSFLPEELRNYTRTYTAKEMNDLLNRVAQEYPDRFADILKKVSDLGRKASWYQGETITLGDLMPVVDKAAIYEQMDAEIAALPRDVNFREKRQEIFQKYNQLIEKETAKNALANRNNIAMAVLSGARGKNPQLKAMISTPGTYSDYKDRPIDVFSRESFAEGIRPAAFLASTFGSRASVVSTKSSTAKGGDWAKQMASVAADMVVRKPDCGSHNGISLPIDDKSLKGRALAKETAGIPAGTFIDRQILRRLEKAGVKSAVVRSPLTCNVSNGLCAHCVGKFYNGGKLPKVGDHIGSMASTASSEPVTQMALCLSLTTEVRMADGSVKAIKDICVGEQVLGADRQGNTFPIDVLNVFDQGEKDCFLYEWRPQEISDITSASVICTPDHKFLRASGEVIPVNVRKYGSQLREYITSTPGNKLYIDLAAASVGKVHCYDIEVNHPDHLFVLANGLICSNSAKHTAGMTKGKKSYSGLEVIQQFTQSPEAFKDRAAVSETDGRVESIEEAPQGGLYIAVNGERHYVPAGHEAIVKEGDEVEAGDQLSEGLMDPEDVVRLKGLGAGRLYYANRLNQILADSGAPSDKRNTEVLARAALRHVRITDPDGMGVYLPDDVVDYNAVQASYTLPETAAVTGTKDAVGMYLQQPVMHYSIGTKVTPKVARDLLDNDYQQVWADKYQPVFEPELVRLRTASHSTRDWLASQATSYLGKQLNEAATRGDDTNIRENDDYRARLAVGEGFGHNVRETGKF